MPQNIYDDPEFFAGYSQLPRSREGLAGLGIKLTHSGYGNRSFLYHRDIPSM
jgi:hypothetical protein